MRITRVVTAAAVLLLLAACAPDPATPGSTTGPSSSSSAAPEEQPQERETGLVAPTRVFGGDCEALFTTSEISASLGIAVTLRSADEVFGGRSKYVEQHGGIRCQWAADEFAASVYVIAFPDAAVSYTSPTDCDVQTESGQTGCSLEQSASGTRLSGAVFRADNDGEQLRAAQSALLALFEERAADAANAAPLPIPAVGAWAWPVKCAEVVAAGDFSAVPGLGATVTGEQTGGSDAYIPLGETALWGEYAPPSCAVFNGDVFVVFDALGGGRWTESDALARPGASTIAVEGVDTVVLSPEDAADYIRVDAYSGPNWVSFYVRYAANAGVAAQALVAALDTTALG